MKRPNTAIEDFIANYSTNTDENTFSMNIMDDMYDFGDEEGDDQDTTDVSTTTATTSTVAVPTIRNTRPYASPVKKSRYQMLCEDPESSFAKAIAGAMLRDLEDVYIREDVDRAIQLDYDTQLVEKQRQSDTRRLNEDIERLVTRIVDEKKKLIGQEAIDMVILIEDQVAELRALIFGSDNVKYTYEDLWRDIADVELVLSDNPDRDTLTRFIKRYYEEAGITKDNEKVDFASEAKELTGDDDLKGIAVVALREKIAVANPVSHQLAIEYLPAIIPDELRELITDVKKEAGTSFIKGEIDAILYGVRVSKPLQERITPQHGTYYAYMNALFNVRDDVMARNELTKNVNLAAIHEPALNERIKSMREPNVLRIIDTSKDYFRELYTMNATPVEQYILEKEGASIDAYRETIYKYGERLTELKNRYNERIGSVIGGVLAVINTDGSILNGGALDSLRRPIVEGGVTRRQLTMSLIRDASFRVYYQNALKQLSPSIDSNEKKKFDAFRETVQLLASLCDYIMGHDDTINEALVDMETTLHQLRGKEMQMIRDESETPISRRGVSTVSPPIELKPDIRDKIDEAYNLVQKYCTKLVGLPLSVIKSPESLRVGLGGEFARYVAALYADCQLSYQDSYKSIKTFENVAKRKNDVLARLKEYTYTSVGSTKFHIARRLS